MSDQYQAVYDAIRSKFFMPDVSDIISRAFDISFQAGQVQQSFQEAAYEQMRPCVLMRPKIYPDGDQWCVLYGDDLQSGVCAYGETPAKAMQNFDLQWLNAKAGPSVKADEAKP